MWVVSTAGRFWRSSLLCLLLLVSVTGCSWTAPQSQSTASSKPGSQPLSDTRHLGELIESGDGYRLDEDGLVVVHLRGTEAQMSLQYQDLLREEISEFRALSRNHRGMAPYLGGCSNFAAFGPLSADGSLWHGRNFDFGGHGLLDRLQVVYIVEPEGRLPYATISWPGPYPWNYQAVHTAMNVKGLSLGYMISQSPEETSDGVLVLWKLFRTVIEKAGTIDEAVAILRVGPRSGAANLLLAEGSNPDAVVVEMTSKDLVVRPAENGAVYSTNHFVSAELSDPEIKDTDSAGRLERLAAMTSRHAPPMDLAVAASVLRDRRDPHTLADSPDGDIVGTPLNMLSVVFHPGDLTFWVSKGPAPAAYRPFVGFSLEDELNGVQAQTSTPPIPVDATLDADSWAEIEAYQSGRRLFDAGDDADAAQEFSKALTYNPHSARYGYALGGALMNLSRYDEAITALEAGLQGDPQSVYRAYIYFRLGTIYEQRGEQDKMRGAFEQVLAIHVGDAEIESYARRALGQ